jgi:hypothetical protein
MQMDMPTLSQEQLSPTMKAWQGSYAIIRMVKQFYFVIKLDALWYNLQLLERCHHHLIVI